MAHNGDFIVFFDCKCCKKVFSAPRTKVFRISVQFHLDMDMHMQNPLRSHSCNERFSRLFKIFACVSAKKTRQRTFSGSTEQEIMYFNPSAVHGACDVIGIKQE